MKGKKLSEVNDICHLSADRERFYSVLHPFGL
jgi:hypothetical protein